MQLAKNLKEFNTEIYLPAIIVLYYPKDDFWLYLKSISGLFSQIVLVDNTPNDSIEPNSASHILPGNIEHIQLKKNMGIAYALNTGCQKVFSLGYTHCVLFDQDSRILANFITTMEKLLLEIDIECALLGLGYKSNNIQLNTLKPTREVKTIITSGTVISNNVYSKTGEFKNFYFIDSVDHEYCLRARKNGFRVLKSNIEVMNHTIGETTDKIPVHNAHRNYFKFRNTIITMKLYWTAEPAWCAKQILRLTVEFLHILAFEKEKSQKVRAASKGIIDSFRQINDQ